MKSKGLWKQLKRYKFIYILLLPVALYFIIFSYYPLVLGIGFSFQKSKLIGPSEFVAFENYQEVFTNPLYYEALINTVIVGIATFMVRFTLGLMIALSLNEIKTKLVKSAIQSVSYLPHILSWSIVGGMWLTILSPGGLLNGLLELLNGSDFSRIVFMSEPAMARTIMVLTGAWKGAGYYAVLFLAAIISIDLSLYEAAEIDGATRLEQITYIILPNIVSTMKVIILLESMGLLRNFDQIFVMGNSNIFAQVRNLLYLIYTDGIVNFKVGLSTAAATMLLIVTFVLATIVRKALKYDQTYN